MDRSQSLPGEVDNLTTDEQLQLCFSFIEQVDSVASFGYNLAFKIFRLLSISKRFLTLPVFTLQQISLSLRTKLRLSKKLIESALHSSKYSYLWIYCLSWLQFWRKVGPSLIAKLYTRVGALVKVNTLPNPVWTRQATKFVTCWKTTSQNFQMDLWQA